MEEDDWMALSQKDRDRLRELHLVREGHLTQGEAGRRLGICARQIRRLLKRVRREGDRGVVHRLRGRPSNRRLARGVRTRALGVLSQPSYWDFGPTLAAEHLKEHGLEVSRETVRKWLAEAGLRRARSRKVKQVHVWRERRASFGELVLMDTSEHEWLEGRGPRLCLIALIDDATSRLWCRFAEHDTTLENLGVLRGWLERFGRPLALYTDRDSIFYVARTSLQERLWGPAPLTHFGRALQELRIEWIAARSPQAKGRVERLFGTLQDRLVKAMRIAGVASCAEANRFLDDVFLPAWERRFTKSPRRRQDAHRPLGELKLDEVLCLREPRKLTADYTLSFRGQRYAVPREQIRAGLRRATVEVRTGLDGTVWASFGKHRLSLDPLPETASASPSGLRPPGLAEAGRHTKRPRHTCRPSKDHPWRRFPATRTFLPGGNADISTLR